MTARNLPPLEVGQAYRATDFERFEYFAAQITGSSAILRLHLKNATTIDLPASDAELQTLMATLCEAFPPAAIRVFETFHQRGWI